MLKVFRHPPIIAVLIYGVFTLMCGIVGLGATNGESGGMLMLPIFPWYLGGLFIIFGYSLIFLLNAILIYFVCIYFFRRSALSLPVWALPITLAVSYVPWALYFVYYSTICSGKFCEISSIMAISPIYAPLFDHPGDSFLHYIAVICNALVIFLIGVAVEKIRTKK